jgi:predicted porin
MNKGLLLGGAIGVAVACTSVQAQMKDPLPDSLSLGGITIYGTVDIGYAYQTSGVPLSSSLPGGLEYQAFTTTRNFSGSQSTVAESGLEQSKIGIRVDQTISGDLKLVARAETGFNPLSGELTDACKSIESNSGVPQGSQNANADSSRCGQLFNSQLYGGVASPQMGQITVGRHNSPQLDALAMYDPQALSYAFSFLGYSGFDGGGGSTQAARWNNSARYAFTAPQFRLVAMYSNGGQDVGIISHAWGGDLGVTAGGLSADFVYENVKGAVNLRSSFDNAAAPLPVPGLAAYISNNTSYNIMAKYVADMGNKEKLTLYAGYTHIEKAHADYNCVTTYVNGSCGNGGNAQNDTPINVAININNSAEYNFGWIGARYAMSSGLNLVGAFYHLTQNSWTIGLTPSGNQGIGCSAAGLLCSGTFNEISGVVDYIFNKHYDVYGGINWSEVQDGLASGFPNAGPVGTAGSQNQTTFMFGLRVKF